MVLCDGVSVVTKERGEGAWVIVDVELCKTFSVPCLHEGSKTSRNCHDGWMGPLAGHWYGHKPRFCQTVTEFSRKIASIHRVAFGFPLAASFIPLALKSHRGKNSSLITYKGQQRP